MGAAPPRPARRAHAARRRAPGPASRRQPMTAPNRGVLQLILAVLAAAGCAWSWAGAQSVVEVAPVIDGEPTTTSVVYDAPLLTLALLLAAVAGVLVVLAVANLRRRREALRPYT